tara:strand:+ start:904 stop:1284 length:381 start_codon:yes stop_codon:yes gene_type:complete
MGKGVNKKFVKVASHSLKNIIEYVELITVSISIIILCISIFNTTYKFIIDKFNNEKEIDLILLKTDVLKNISLALSLILAIEILKIFFIRSYRQLITVISLGLLKVIISYFIGLEIDEKNKVENNH